MVHLRIVTPPESTARVTEVLERSVSVCNVIVLPGAAIKPPGDVVLCDVAREDASVVLEDLRRIGIQHEGSIAVENIETAISDAMEHAVEAAKGEPADAVIWEEVEAHTSESATLSFSFATFMVLAGLIAAVGIFLNSPILIVGAMVVGPEFGPIAGFCVAAVQRRRALAGRSFLALAVGFPLAIAAVFVTSLVFKATGVTPAEFSIARHDLAGIIASPDFLAFFVAFCAGIAGMLSLSTAKSSALIGVFISITTIPAAANVGISAAYGDWDTFAGSLAQLALNLTAIVVAGVLTLAIQRSDYRRRRARHLRAANEPRQPSALSRSSARARADPARPPAPRARR